MVRALPNCSQATEQDAEDWLNSDAHEQGWKLSLPEELIGDDDNEATVKDEDEESGEEDEALREREALKALRYLMGWYQTTWECTPEKMRVLEDMREYLITDVLFSNRI